VSKSASQPNIVDLAEQTARRRAPSSPRQKQRVRAMRRFGAFVVLITGSSLIYVWLLFS
jgi:hypothetical protein